MFDDHDAPPAEAADADPETEPAELSDSHDYPPARLPVLGDAGPREDEGV